ncbi:predicted protein [Streptomyces viridochromogenes DSM 40736]|uniref:Predicted protein n=1 Tax=Streptomyces viridochromogenes (strain DSM 40736 / JCM 4977 / BCRC 1201 / Tue 494) TaxID=591159 RepID=D9XHV9_STRVT|nr:predicted protein [Streptomyces viridochromogenes DSM 40736]
MQAGLTKTQLAGVAGLGRTVVSEAFSSLKPVSSAHTVAALARVLRRDAKELLDLRTAAVGPKQAGADGLGRLIDQCDPHDLEVHPAIDAPPSTGPRACLMGQSPDPLDGSWETTVVIERLGSGLE